MLPRSSDTGKASLRISVTVRVLYTKDWPKSPWTALATKMPNCSHSGLSSP